MHATIRIDQDTFDVYIARTPDGLKVEVDGETHETRTKVEGEAVRVEIGGRVLLVRLEGDAVVVDGERFPLQLTDVRSGGGPGAHGGKKGGAVKPPMPGKIVAVKVKAGDAVEAGQTLVVLEAMKMQNEIGAPGAGTVKVVHVAPGQNVEAKDVLVELE